MSVKIVALQAEHHESGFGLGHSRPRLSWRFGETTSQGWTQVGYTVHITRQGKGEEKYDVKSADSVLVPWPSSPLASREIVDVRVTVQGSDGSSITSPELVVEVGLLKKGDWKGQFISTPSAPDATKPKKPFRLTNTFTAQQGGKARLYATALGLYKVEINGRPVTDQVLAPGWQSYTHHLNYQVYDISPLLKSGKNTIEATVGEGWYAGRLGFGDRRHHFGERIGFLGQVELDGQVVLASDESWDVSESPIVNSEIYNGETFDTTFTDSNSPSNSKAGVIPFTTAELISTDAPPVRRVREVKPVEIITTPSGKTVVDFGQNLVGWPRINTDLKGTGTGELVIRHAEVLENGELGTRPLRGAKATTTIKLGGKTANWEPSFTFYGFRYVEVTGAEVGLKDFTAIVVASDLRATGSFTSSHELVNQLHKNVIWGMLSNFVSVPTDCPQRDERLGWTGDIQVFAPTANFLFDTSGFLSGWLRDLSAETFDHGGIVPEVVPYVHLRDPKPHPHAIWADVAIITPRDLYTAFGDKAILERQFASMKEWLDKGVPRRENGLWIQLGHQYGDWLDPKAPPAYPAHSSTDPILAANAYLVYVTRLIATIAKTIGKETEAKKYGADYERLLKLFRAEYVSPSGRLVSDTQTALALALHFDLLETQEQRKNAAERLDWLIRWESFKVSTGFAGTPIILDTLAENDKLQVAYRMLQERDNPSWLYPVSMGATTIWERWDSMLPDGRINPGQMTSFNHYALGSVANFLHGVVGGLSPLEPGWKKALIKPQPGGTLTSAKVGYDSAYGPYSVEWKLQGGNKLHVKASVPPNATARVELPGVEQDVGSGVYEWDVTWQAQEWPPKQIKGPTRAHPSDEFVP